MKARNGFGSLLLITSLLVLSSPAQIVQLPPAQTPMLETVLIPGSPRLVPLNPNGNWDLLPADRVKLFRAPWTNELSSVGCGEQSSPGNGLERSSGTGRIGLFSSRFGHRGRFGRPGVFLAEIAMVRMEVSIHRQSQQAGIRP